MGNCSSIWEIDFRLRPTAVSWFAANKKNTCAPEVEKEPLILPTNRFKPIPLKIYKVTEQRELGIVYEYIPYHQIL